MALPAFLGKIISKSSCEMCLSALLSNATNCCLSERHGRDGACSIRLRQQRREKVRFIKVLGEFVLSCRLSEYTVPIAASPTDGASPFPTVGVCDKQQLIQLLTKADMQKMNLRCNTNFQAKFKMANSEAGKHKNARPDVNQGLACLCRMLAALNCV